jgi:COP9 signalosome complex subunit 1
MQKLTSLNEPGRTRYDRLLLVGKTCVPLCVDALKAAVQEAKKGSDVTRYKDAWDCIRFAAPNDPEAQRDEAWIEAIEKANKAETSRLESELKGYKNNLIKESIRVSFCRSTSRPTEANIRQMGHEDLGRHFESIGKLNEAADAYSRMRQDVSTTKHIIDCGMHLVSVSLQRRDWAMALSNIGKITGVQNGEDDKTLQTYFKVVSGLSYLGQGNFLEAAQHFLLADFDVPPSEYSDLASPNDIAVYGGLLALATMDRGELQRRVLENQSFRTFLENEPHIRKAVSFFVNGRYSNCLSILESSRSDFKLDIYLQKHIADIYSRIRSKCIEQYFIPFSCVTLDSLDAAFARPGESVEDELVTMIRSESLKAKIDAKNRVGIICHKKTSPC